MASQNVIDDIDNTQLINNIVVSDPGCCLKTLGDINNQYSIVTQNIRSINKNFDTFLVLLSRLNFKPDLIILTECRLSEYSPNIILDGYIYHCSKNYLNQNDGIVVFAKSSLSVQISEPPFKEANCLLIHVENVLTIAALYRSPSINNVDIFCRSLEKIMQELSTENCAIVGDINIDIKQDTSDTRANEYLNSVAYYGFIPGHQFPTRGPNCLDHVLIKSKLVSQVIVCKTDVTDHDTVLFGILKTPHTNIQSKTRKSYKIDYQELLKDLEETSWNSLYEQQSCSSAFTEFINTMTTKINSHKKLCIKSSAQVIYKQWISPGLLKCIRKRDILHTKARKNKNDLQIQQRYKNYRNYCNNLVQNLKNEYERNLLTEAQGDTKKTWDAVKKVCDLKASKSHSEDILKMHENPSESLNIVNNFFTTVGDTLATKILSNTNTTETKLANSLKIQNFMPPLNSFFLSPTDPKEISKTIINLKPSSSSGHDEISNNILKKCQNVLAAPLAYLCNLSMSEGIVPDTLKVANVCPIFKVGDTLDASNYRPISLLSTVSKVLEKITNVRLLRYLEKERLLSENQYGFRAKKSTEDAVVGLVDYVTQKMDIGSRCIGVFLDLAKAFDTVSRPILLKKMELLGIRGVALKWFQSYLTNRRQRVKVEDSHGNTQLSTYKEVAFGVPQGSVLGPTLFLIYINDLCSLDIPQSKIFTFADDTAVVFHSKDWKSLEKTTETGLAKVSCWLQDNLLTLNTGKTKYVTFAITKRTKPDFPLQIKIHSCHNPVQKCNCCTLEETTSIKYLGIFIDEHLRWTKQIECLCSRVRKLLYIFKRLSYIASSEIIKMTYYALCHSVLQYGITAWGSTTKTNLISLERAQRAILKVAFRKPYRYPTDDLYKTCKVLRVRQIFIMSTALRFHKNAKSLVAISTRSQRLMKWNVPLTKTKLGQRSFKFLGPFLYTVLNKNINIINTTKYTCKKTITNWISTLNYDQTENLLIPKS